MTLYWTDKSTGEMHDLLEPLRHKPKGKVKRLPSPRIVATRSPRYVQYSARRRPRPLDDLALSLACVLLASAILLTT